MSQEEKNIFGASFRFGELIRIPAGEFYIAAIQSMIKLKNATKWHSLEVLGYNLDSRDRARALQAPNSI